MMGTLETTERQPIRRKSQGMSNRTGLEISCGIVTFNPDMNRLAECIAAIAPQVEKVYIYDNASSNIDDIVRVQSAYYPEAELILGSENAGLAVALNALALAAFDDGYSALLLLDQDSVADIDLAQKMAPHLANDVGAVSALTRDRNDESPHPIDNVVFDVPRAITSGMLLNLTAWQDVGGYDERLFVDWVDFDLCANLRLHGYRIVRTHETSILHELGKMEYAGSVPRRDVSGRISMRPYYRTNHTIARRYDRARSQAIVIKKYAGTDIAKEEKSIFVKSVLKGLAFEKHKMRLLSACLRGYREGCSVAAKSNASRKGGVR